MTAMRVAVCALVLLCSRSAAIAWGGCTPGWTPYTGITAPIITNPTAGDNGCGINAEVVFTCSTCYDEDRYQNADCSYNAPVHDGLTYTWTKTGGAWKNGVSTGQTVTWVAPNSPGNYTVTVTVDDNNSPPGTGDPARSTSRTMQVIRLDKVRLYFHHYGTGHPPVGSPFKTRAVLWVTFTSQQAYCGMGFDESLGWWWKAGDEGWADVDENGPIDTPYFDGTVNDYWPSNWPNPTITWTFIEHVGSDPQGEGDYDRIYSYPDTEWWTYLSNSWGEDNRSYSTVGMHRLKAIAKIETGYIWQQLKEFPEPEDSEKHLEKALRIYTKDPAAYIEPSPPPANSAQRRDYIEWISSYIEEPYEWGGTNHGGRDSHGQWAGGAGSYDGYGIDCSGLVSLGAFRAEYNWGWWRKATCDRSAAGRLTDVSTDLGDGWRDVIQPGDILLKPHHHVITYVAVDGTGSDRRWHCIEAHGGPVNKVWSTDQDPQNPDRWWTDTQLDANCACTQHRHWNDSTQQYEPCASNPAPQKYRARSLNPS